MKTKIKSLRVLGSAFISMFVVVGSIFFLQINLPSGAPVLSAALLTPTPRPTSTPPIGQPPQTNVDLKSELFSWGGGGVPTDCALVSLTQSDLPLVFTRRDGFLFLHMNDGIDVCVEGVSTANGDQMIVELFDDQENLVGSTNLVIKKITTDMGVVVTDDIFQRTVGEVGKTKLDWTDETSPLIDFIRISVNLFPGLPREGHWVITTWQYTVESKREEIMPETRGIIINPTNDFVGPTPCPLQYPGGTVKFRAIGLPPDRDIPFGMYNWQPPEGAGDEGKAVLVQSQFLRSDSSGQVDAVIQIPQTAARGSYYLVGVVDPSADRGPEVGAGSCGFRIEPGLALEPPSSSGTEVIFLENFDGSEPDPGVWTVFADPNSLSVNGGLLRLSSSGTRYPYLLHPWVFPQYGDFRFRSRFRYAQVDTCGVGIMVASYTPSARLSQSESGSQQQREEQAGVAVGVWQDRSGMQMWFRSGAERRDVPLGGPDTNVHDLTIDYSEYRYKVHVDDHLIFTSAPTPYRAQHIWMGNPVDLGDGFPCPWDTLEVDQMQVQRIGASVTAAAPIAPVATPVCAIQIGNSLAGLWRRADVSNRLGCPRGAFYTTPSSEESFQHGSMLWRQQDTAIYALYDDGTWSSFPDTFVAGTDPTYSCGEAASPPSPRRGFSKVWCGYEEVRVKLGGATQAEIGYCLPGGGPCEEFQDFAGGTMFYSRRTNSAIVVFNDGTWLR